MRFKVIKITVCIVLNLSWFTVIGQSDQVNVAKYDSLLEMASYTGFLDDLSLLTINNMIDYYESENRNCNAFRTRVIKSVFYRQNGDFEKALEINNNALKDFSAPCDTLILLEAYVQQANIYLMVKNLDVVKDFVLRGLSMCKDETTYLDMRGRLYSSLGNAFVFLNETDSASVYYRKALVESQKSKLDFSIEKAYFNLSVVKYIADEIDSAKYFLNRSFLYADELQSYSSKANIYNMKSVYEEDTVNKLLYLDSAIYFADKVKSYINLEKYYLNKSMLYADLKLFEEAYNNRYYSNYYKDSVFSNDLATTTAILNEKYEAGKRMLEISKLTLEKKEAELASEVANSNLTRLYFLGAMLVVFIVVVVVRYREVKKNKDLLFKKNYDLKIEKERSETLLLNILPKEVADELKEFGEVKARSFNNVTIMLCDIKGFTKITENIEPEELVAEINVCFKAFDNILDKYKIDKIKTIGDAYMAAGGLLGSTNNSCIDVVHAALEMQAFMKIRKEERKAQEKVPFEMRLGIHTGSVIAGIVGYKKFQYDLWGDTVNTAARMESNCEINQVNVSETTYTIIENEPNFKFKSRGTINVKGKGDLKMWYVQKA